VNTTIKPVAIVTGAGTGIGKATAYALLKEGYNVIFVGRRLDRLDESLKSSPHPHLGSTFALDIGKPNEVLALFTFIREKFGRLDLLFNNAGQGTPAKLFDEITFDEWQAVVNVNLTGAFLCAQQAFKLMREQLPQGGRIINNGSISAHTPRPFSAPYTATKHAITGLTKSLALDGRPFGIACGQIDIGNAATEMTDRMASGIIQADGSTKPEMRMDVNHVAQAVCNMAKLPLESNVLFMTIMATNMPFVGRG
jgi:NAD(P)-dependent dehydrogenase (short-subunit alcohol dehydrogenase family)